MAKLPNKFAIFLQYLMKSEWDKVDCLHVQDHEGFLQINTMVLIGMVKHSKVAIKVNLQSLQYLKQQVKDELIFCMQINRY